MSAASVLPLSLAQRDFVFPRGNMNASIRLRGKLSLPALHRALGFILRRHEGLRMRLVRSSGLPRQRIAEEIDPYDMPVLEVADFAAAEQRLVAALRAPADLENEGPLHVELLRLGEEDHVLVLAVHTIAIDSHALGLLLRELLIAYDGYVQEREPSLPPAMRYRDCLSAEDRLGERLSDAQRQHWRAVLSGSRDPIPRREAPSAHTAGFSRSAVCSITAAEAKRVQEFAFDAHVSVAAALHAILFLAVASRYAVRDVLATVSYSGRDTRALATLCAKTARLFPLRIAVDEQQSLARFAQSVQSTFLRGAIASRAPFTVERAAQQASAEPPRGTPGVGLVIADDRMSQRELTVPTADLSAERILVGSRPYQGLEGEETSPLTNALVLSILRDPTLQARRPVVIVAAFYSHCLEESEVRRLLDRVWAIARMTCSDHRDWTLAELFSQVPCPPDPIPRASGIAALVATASSFERPRLDREEPGAGRPGARR